MPKPLPIGISDFKEIIKKGYLYIDKTLFIEELFDKSAKALLIPRPRRFGKTLNLSMLRYFFEKTSEDTSYLFQDLNIWKKEKYRALQGTFPVIFISLKDVRHTSWEKAFASFTQLIATEFQRHDYLLEGKLLAEQEKEIYRNILSCTVDSTIIERSILYLSEWLHRYYGKEVIILIDEYDTPLHAAYFNGYYDTMIELLHNWLSSALKDNMYLARGVLTGILRIAKENIFSGLTFTLFHEPFSDKFGLTDLEVRTLLEEYGFSEKYESIQKWYDGYRIGSSFHMYNPWSVLNCIEEKGKIAPYWVNTSDNALINRLISQGGKDLKSDLELLLSGEVIEKECNDTIVFSYLEKNTTMVWTLLLFTGYIALDAPFVYGTPCRLRIPNAEVQELYKSIILQWFQGSINVEYTLLLKSLISGDIDTFSEIFEEFMLSSVSVFDVPVEDSEKIYHGFVLGMLVGLKDHYEVKSNRESGLGRYDVLLIPKDPKDLGIVMEFKKVRPSETLELAVESALKQIEEKQYSQELLDRGIQRILHLGFGFLGKKVLIKSKFFNKGLNPI